MSGRPPPAAHRAPRVSRMAKRGRRDAATADGNASAGLDIRSRPYPRAAWPISFTVTTANTSATFGTVTLGARRV